MTYEEVKSLFKNIHGKQARLEAMLTYINDRLALMQGVGAVNYDRVTVNSSPGNSTEERYIREIDRLKELQKRYDILHEDMCNDEKLIFDLMQLLSPTEYEVILNRYLRGLGAKKVAKLMGYSLDGLYDIQARAIKKMCKS